MGSHHCNNERRNQRNFLELAEKIVGNPRSPGLMEVYFMEIFQNIRKSTIMMSFAIYPWNNTNNKTLTAVIILFIAV